MTKFEPYNNTGGTKFSSGMPPVYVFCGFAVVMFILGFSIWLISPLLDNAVSNAVSTVASKTPVTKQEVTEALNTLSKKASLDLHNSSV